MGPLIALLPTLMNLLQSKKQQAPQQPQYNMAPPVPEGSNPDDPNGEIAKSRAAIANMQMPPEDESIGKPLSSGY